MIDWIFPIVFLICLALILYLKKRQKLEAQFVVTGGIILIVFYIVGILSGICTILNFVWRWLV